MIMNRFEFLLMNNPVRRTIQEFVEVRKLRALSTLSKNKTILEIGCGSGNGAKLIKKYFQPKEIWAVDLDANMIKAAKKRVKDPKIKFEVGDASKLRFKINQFDAIVDFGIIHHIPNWKECLNELKRVLKPGGELILEDLSIETFSRGIGTVYKKVLDHPYEDMYSQIEFICYLEKIGFKVQYFRQFDPLGLLKYFVVVAKK